LISIPNNQSESHFDFSLSSLSGSYDAIQYYNISNPSDYWEHNKILKPSVMNDFYKIDHKMGFWIYITEPKGVIFEYTGSHPTTNQTIPLHPGWNMVGYPSLSNPNRTVGLNNLEFGLDVDAIQWYDAATQTWHFMGPDDVFVPGRGYWAHSKVDKSWIVPL
jgi:hypothetical protein